MFPGDTGWSGCFGQAEGRQECSSSGTKSCGDILGMTGDFYDTHTAPGTGIKAVFLRTPEQLNSFTASHRKEPNSKEGVNLPLFTQVMNTKANSGQPQRLLLQTQGKMLCVQPGVFSICGDIQRDFAV